MTIQAHNIQTLVGLHSEALHYALELRSDSDFNTFKSNLEAMQNAKERFHSFAKNLIESTK